MANALIQSIFKGLEMGVAVIMVILVKDMMIGLYKRDHKGAMVLLALSIVINYALQIHVIFILILNLVAVLVLSMNEKRALQ